jgi:hypothetical protein
MNDDLATTLAQGQDDLIIGGGGNDILSGGATAASLAVIIDEIFVKTDAAFAAGTINKMIFRGLTPIKGYQFAGAWTQAKQDAIDGTNLYLKNKCATIPYCQYVNFYNSLVSSAVPDAIQGTYWVGGVDQGQTSPSEGYYTEDGIHFVQGGASLTARSLDQAVRDGRYYKGGRA